jgi:hypothetical protein
MIDYTKENILEAIKDSGGIISTIAKTLKCEWHTAERYINLWDETKEAYQDECEIILDKAESKMIEAIESKDMQMVRYLLSTKGKKRGYTERHELTGEEGKNIKIEFVDSE